MSRYNDIMTPKLDRDEVDDSRADEFRCLGCETPLPIRPGSRVRFCADCREERGHGRRRDDE